MAKSKYSVIRHTSDGTPVRLKKVYRIRYQVHGGKVRHVDGDYPTRAGAEVALNKFIRKHSTWKARIVAEDKVVRA